MTWEEFSVARRLVAEERVGSKVRTAQAREDAKFARAVKAGKTPRKR